MRTESPSAPTRRTLLIGSAATLLVAAEGDKALPQTLRVRHDVASSQGQKMADLYNKAVTAMQDPAINYPPQPTSWTFQAYIHGVPANPFDPANSGGIYNGSAAMKKRIDEIYGNPAAGTPQAAWKEAALACWATCTHGSPYFTTWHRWYMYYFERVCREMCKDASFTLPYWNYASNIGSSLQIPAKFQDSNTRLYFDDRGLGFANPQGTGQQNVAMNNNGYMPYPLIQYGPALTAKVMFPSDTMFFAPSQPQYYQMGFTGRMECVPHDMVHDSVGGWMGNIPSAAGDPVFYVHHCQVDRLYASWEAEPGVSYNWGNSSTQPSENTWKNRTAHYVDEKGKLVQVKLGDAINTTSLGYQYDNLATPPPAQVAALPTLAPTTLPSIPPLTLAAMRSNGFAVRSGGASVTLTPESTAPGPSLAPATPGANPTTLVLEGLKLVRRPPAPLSVFLNLPQGTRPELNGPYYVGTLNLFNFDLGTGGFMAHSEDAGHADHTPAQTGEARFDVGSVLARQRAQGLWDGGAITVTISTVGADQQGNATYVTFTGVELTP
jgi:tyrosinase